MIDSYNFPDGWVGLKIRDVYKIFCSWSGGYLHGDSWRMNSGTEDIEEIENSSSVKIKGYSGSVYVCNKFNYGDISVYNSSVLKNFLAQLEENNIQYVVFDTANEFIESFRDAKQKDLI